MDLRVATTLILYIALALSGCSSCKRKADPSYKPMTPGAAIPTLPWKAAYVTNNASDSISVLDRDGDTITTVPIDMDPDEHEAPHHLVVDPRGGHVFVALAFPPEAAGSRSTSKKDPHASHGSASDVGKVARLELRTLAMRHAVDVDENPGDVVMTHDRARLLVTHFDMKRAMNVAAKGGGSPATMFAHLVVLDASSLTRIGSRAICTAPHGMAVTKDDQTAFVACYGSDEIAVVDLSAEGLPTSRVPLGATPGVPGVPRYGPYSATLTPDESRVVIADLEGQDLRVFDRKQKAFASDKTTHLAAKAFMPAFIDDKHVLVPLQAPDGLALVNVEEARVTKRTTFPKSDCSLPHVVRVAKDGRVYLVCEGDHVAPGSVLEIDKDSLAMKKRWTVGAYPDGIDFGEE